MENVEAFIIDLVKKGGPEPSQYKALNHWFQKVGQGVREKKIAKPNAKKMQDIFGDALSEKTLQGLIIHNAHGYAGNFEVIDKIYTQWISEAPHLQKWDKFSHWQDASVAVRNRKEYFKQQLSRLENSDIEHPKILNTGSGPSRDIYEYQLNNPSTKLSFECVDMDRNAIRFSKNLLKNTDCKIHFHHQNAFRFKSDTKYNLVWSAGLFDYLNEKQFIFLMRALFKMVATQGELIIGNFSDNNPSQDCMEFLQWHLFHRTETELSRLANLAGCKNICIDQEERGVNLFMRAKKFNL